MPSGKIHNALTLATVTGVLAPYLIVQFDGNPWLYGAGCVAGLLVSPDMDVDKGNISDQIIRKVSRPAQWLWRLFWTPYALFVPHRNFVSHFPIFGTLVRMGYIFIVINLINLLLFTTLRLFDTVSLVWLWNWSFFFGLCHVDAIHFVVDKTIKGRETFEDA
jgi:uncharacterized metal-binding protein